MGSMWILGCVLRHRFGLIEVFVTYRASNSGLWLQPVKKNISHLFQLCVYNCIYNYTHINQGKNEISLVFDHH
jgi:hypothetical protein